MAVTMIVNEESAGSMYLLLRILLYNTKASARAAVVLELPGSTRTWQRVLLASQLTLRRSEQLIPVAKHSPLSVSNHHNYAPSSWKD